MNKRQKEVIQAQLDSEKAVLEQLEKQYTRALNDIDKKIRILQSDELTQSRIYRLEYQKALKEQVKGVLEKLHSDEYTTIQQFLSASYTDAFVGTAYDLFGQGVPLIMPIDPEEAVKAVLTDSKINGSLYESLGVDVNKLKKTISSEISRGIAGGMSYSDIAKNISRTTKAPMARARTIVQTESHRIQQAARHNARVTAKSKGADIVKQWNSTLDGGTRDTHRKLDGQIRELDEPFEVGGMKAMYPGDFGDPAEDCNCRCEALQRAKWALGEAELETLKERAAYFDLDKTDDFESFKKTYLKASEQSKTLEKSDKKSIIKSLKVDDIKAAASGGSITEEVANTIANAFEKHNGTSYFSSAVTKNLGNNIVFQTDPQKVGTFFDTVLVMNEDMLGGRSVSEINTMFKTAKNTVVNSLDEAVVHEIYHAKLIDGMSYAKLDALYDELGDIHIDGVSKIAFSDGAECIAETGVMIERGEKDKVPSEALELFERFFKGL